MLNNKNFEGARAAILDPKFSLAEVEQTNTQAQTPLMITLAASIGKRIALSSKEKRAIDLIIELLILHGASIRFKDANGVTALMLASRSGNLNTVKILIESDAKIDDVDKSSRTALMYAAKSGHTDIVTFLVKSGANIHLLDTFGQTAMMQAIASGREGVVECLLSLTSELEIRDKNGHTALQHAITQGYDKLVEVLLKSGMDVNARGPNGETPLLVAAAAGNVRIVDLLLQEGASIEITDHEGHTAIHVAASQNRDLDGQAIIKNISTMIDDASKVEGYSDEDDFSAFFKDGSELFASSNALVKGNKDFSETLRVLITGGGNPNALNKKSKTALHLAAANKHEHLVQTLLDSGATVQEEDSKNDLILKCLEIQKSRSTLSAMSSVSSGGASEPIPLILSGSSSGPPGTAISSAPAITKVSTQSIPNQGNKLAPTPDMALPSENEEMSLRNAAGQTSLMAAAANGLTDVVQIMIYKGAPVNARDFKGFTALMLAAAQGHEEVVKLLIAAGTKVDVKNAQGWTAIGLALVAGHASVAQLILAAGGNTSFKIKGITLLMMVAAKGFKDCVEFLLSSGSDPAQADYKAKTAIDYARESGYPEIEQMLIKFSMKKGGNSGKKDGSSAYKSGKRKLRW